MMLLLLKYVPLLLTIILLSTIGGKKMKKSRAKRYLVYPLGGQLKVVVGVSWPVPLGLKQSMACAVNLQFQYPQAQNITQIQNWPPIITRSQEKRSYENRESDRMAAYLGLESILDKYGLNGHQCLLRSICDNAMNPLNHNANGLYGRLLNIFLSPDYGDGQVDPDLGEEYVDAQKAGFYGVDCVSLYPGCPYGTALLDMISIFK